MTDHDLQRGRGGEHPRGVEAAEKYIRFIDGVAPEMLNAEYWYSGNADRVLMTAEEIAALPVNDFVRLSERERTLNAGYLRKSLAELAALKPEDCFLKGRPVSQAYLDNLIGNANLNSVDPALPLRYGWSVRRASLRRLPTNDFLAETANHLFYDQAVSRECPPYMPAIVLHESRDGKWVFVWLYEGSGWLEKENIALCPSREDWIRRQREADFLVVTGREIRLNVDRGCDAVSGLLLPMGTKIPLMTREEAPAYVAGRKNYYSYVVRLPVRGENGMIEDVTGLIPMTDDVHAGYLPYTPANVLGQFFKRLGDRYGWGGLDNSNDCSGIVCETYRCFGLELSRTLTTPSLLDFGAVTYISEYTTEEKLAVLSGTIPGSLLKMPGHNMIYLGMKDNVPYVISAVGDIVEQDMDRRAIVDVYTVCVSDLSIFRESGKTWLESLAKIVTLNGRLP